jgi:DNA-binding transcriptional LysR family regulator
VAASTSRSPCWREPSTSHVPLCRIRLSASRDGFVEGAVESPQLVSEPIARGQLIIVTGPEHLGPRAGPPKARALGDSEWVLREPGSGTRSEFEQALTGLGIERAGLLDLASNEAARAALEAGLGTTATLLL